MNVDCHNIATLVIKIILLNSDQYDKVMTIATEIGQWFHENFERMGLQNHSLMGNRILYKVHLNNALWRAEIFNSIDIGIILLHMDRLLLDAYAPPAEDYEWKDQIIPFFQRVFNLTYEMFPLTDGEEFKDWFIYTV